MMQKQLQIIVLFLMASALNMNAQSAGLGRIDFLIGSWKGKGEGFGNQQSTIQAEYRYVMNGNYIEATHESEFQPTQDNPEGETHRDHGFISYDKERELLVYRQFNNEGYINRYILDEAQSSDTMLVFVTEAIEGFIPGGKARLTMIMHHTQELETVFDVSLPGSDYACFGTNRLTRNQ